jgi:hypothetical protein
VATPPKVGGYIWNEQLEDAHDANRETLRVILEMLEECDLSELAITKLTQISINTHKGTAALNRLDRIVREEAR